MNPYEIALHKSDRLLASGKNAESLVFPVLNLEPNQIYGLVSTIYGAFSSVAPELQTEMLDELPSFKVDRSTAELIDLLQSRQ